MRRAEAAEQRCGKLDAQLHAERARAARELGDLNGRLAAADARMQAMLTSTGYLITGPLRLVGARLPEGLRLKGRRALRVLWWTATLQLPKRLRERKAWRPKVASLRSSERHGPLAVVIDDRWPEPDRDSGSLDAVNVISSLVSFGYHTIVAKCTELSQEPRYRQGLQEIGAVPHYAEGQAAVRALIERHGQEVSVFLLTRVAAGGQFLESIRYYAPDARIIFNTVDLHFLRESRAARLAGDAAALGRAEKIRDREELLTGRCDLTIVVSEVEREILSNAVPGASILHLPLARTVRRPAARFAERSGIGFIGGFAHQPNIDAVRYFLREIWPLVVMAAPSLRFEIAGADLPLDILEDVPGEVHYIGPVEDLDGWFDGLRLTVAPLRIGAGVKGKVVSSLCAGLPCVASPVAAEGIGLTAGENILVGETVQEFAEHVLRLQTDPELWERLSANASRFAEQTFAVANFRARLRRALIGLQLPAFAEPPTEAGAVRAATPAAAKVQMRPRAIFTCRSRAEYNSFTARHRQLLAGIKAYEEQTPRDEHYMQRGRCAVCDAETDFLVDYQHGFVDAAGQRHRNWRERLECQRCRLNNRMRAVVQLMLGNLRAGSRGSVYLTEQVTPLFTVLKARIPDIVGSEFLRDGTPRGAFNASGVRHEDLTALSFPDASFQCIGSFDVLEHVPDYRRGLSELARCLTPGGWLLLSTPFFPDYDRTLVRAVVAGGSVEHLCEPEFHGDPLAAEGVLCFYHFGWSLLDELAAAGFREPRIALYWSRRYGHLGGLQPVLLAQRR